MNDLITAVLVIDDEEMVRDNIEEILVPGLHDDALIPINDAIDILFDTPKPIMVARKPHIPAFTVSKAANGHEGLRLVIQSIEQRTPYAVIFIDMRMPGWSGLETAMEIRKYDQKVEIIFITAFSDRSIEEIVEQAGQNVGYHCKPYAPEEILQLATKAVTDYNKLRNLESLIESISSIGLNRNQLTALLKNILEQLAGSLNTDLALIGKLHPDYRYEKLLSIGALEEHVDIARLVDMVREQDMSDNEVLQTGDLVIARLDNYSVFALLSQQERMKTEKMYLLKLFVQNAAQAIKNAELQEKLVQSEKLSAVGQVISMVMHDLRSPIKNIHVITGLIREEGCSDELLSMIERSAYQASEIFDDFLDFIRKTKINKRELSLNEIIATVLAGASNQAQALGINIITDIPNQLSMMGDGGKLQRALSNLLNNSIEALSACERSDKTIRWSANPAHDTIRIMISDNGPGIPDTIADTLFEPFVTKNKAGGTGLGLAIVAQYIEAHGGSITVHNDNGAVFEITLPLEVSNGSFE